MDNEIVESLIMIEQSLYKEKPFKDTRIVRTKSKGSFKEWNCFCFITKDLFHYNKGIS